LLLNKNLLKIYWKCSLWCDVFPFWSRYWHFEIKYNLENIEHLINNYL